MLHYCIIA